MLSGVLVWLSFPAPGMFYLAWIALVPLFHALFSRPLKNAPWIGLIGGFTASAGLVYWIYPTVHQGTGSAVVGIACLGALALYMALYVALWSVLVRFVWTDEGGVFMPLGAAALWTGTEFLRSYVLNGFTWGFLGYSQTPFLPLVQIAELSGVYGLSFLVVLVNACIYRGLRNRHLAYPLVAVGIVALLAAGGERLGRADTPAAKEPVKVAVLQGNIDQYKKWDMQFRDEIRAVYDSLARSAAAEKPDMIIWPETSVPGWMPGDGETMSWVSDLVRRTATYNIVGTAFMGNDGRQYNASVLMTPRGEIAGVHKKTRLVAFGEFIPFRSVIGKYVNALNETGDLAPGEKPEVLTADGIGWGANICSENFFGDVTRRSVNNGADIIVNQTNDGWYGDTAQPAQHFAMNIVRAVETRRPIVVCANTGISAVVGPDGRVTKALPLFKPGYSLAQVYPSKTTTVYVRYGDLFAGACCAFGLLALGVAMRRRFAGGTEAGSHEKAGVGE